MQIFSELLYSKEFHVFLWAFLGGAVRWAALSESAREGVRSTIVGGVSGYALYPWYNPMAEKIFGASAVGAIPVQPAAFLAGFGGVLVIGGFFDIFQSLYRARNKDG